MPALFPPEGFRAAANTIVEGVIRVRHRVVGLPRHVLQDELDGVHLHLIGHVIHHGLDTEKALRKFGRAVVPGDRPVGIHRIDDTLDVGALIELDPADASRILAVRPHAAIAAQLKRLEHALAADPNLVVLRGRPAAVNPDEILFARHFQLHRRARFLRQHRGDQVSILILVLVADAAAHVLADDAHLLVGDSQISGHVMATIRRALGRRIQGQLLALPVGDTQTRLHLRVLNIGGGVAIFEHEVGRAEAFLDVTAAIHFWLYFVFHVGGEVALRPNLDAPGAERRLLIEHERKHLIINVDEPKSLLREMAVGRGHGRHRLSEKTHGVIEQIAFMQRNFFYVVNILPATRDRASPPDDTAILVRQNKLDAR